MADQEEIKVYLTAEIPLSLRVQLDRIAERLTAQLGVRVTRSDVTRQAIGNFVAATETGAAQNQEGQK